MEQVMEFIIKNKYTLGIALGGSLLLGSYLTPKNQIKYERDVVYVADFPSTNTDLPSYSPFVLKVIVFLEYNSIPYHVDKSGKLGPNPRGKNPFIRYNDEFVYDSHFIIEWLKTKFNIVTNMEILDNVEEAKSYLVKRFVDEAFTKLVAYNRWVDPVSSKEILPRMFSGIENKLIRNIVMYFVQRGSRKSYTAQGVGLYTKDEINSFVKSDILALATLLGEKKFFYGDNLTVSDISIFSALAQILFVPVETPLREILLQNQNLVDYIENVKTLVFSDAKWTSLCK
ncbi:hypothetical protein DICPUDRAFT_51896 [Dictyostelium purpureum]|uniref:GST C-terminal domain-containing protein n=1 Tax=Dictyostelium purpureum TaxID=5786 RepID=F1A622_DICPU|nr:uncharacterized protein DICPUDRAFT_51896 [Dictyostelium purpureum]EGC28358.1 hypothetical protein DICPUDRAFT_51896 [Dictyostelium purpureum]|eukprot:XP_003295116.1 hypothetical protein DICPUDRAFT_51896 [Dictyostelium purpureum]